MMNLLNYIKEVRQRGQRYFTLKQILAELHLSKNAALNVIARGKSRGELISPCKGLYVIVPAEHQLQGSIPAEELVPILMHYLQADYYVSLLSGAGFYGAAHQKPSRFQIMSNKRIKHSLEFGQVKLELIYKKSIKGLPLKDFTVATGFIKVGCPELIAFDLLNYPTRSGGLNHIATVLTELIEAVDADKLIALAKKIGEKAWLQRLGFILEQIEPMDKEKAIPLINKIQNFLEGKIRVFVPLAPELPKMSSPRLKKWRIIANTNIESDL